MEKDKRKFGFFSAEAYPSSKLSAAAQSSEPRLRTSPAKCLVGYIDWGNMESDQQLMSIYSKGIEEHTGLYSHFIQRLGKKKTNYNSIYGCFSKWVNWNILDIRSL